MSEKLDRLRERAADPEKLHAYQHELIDERVNTYRSASRRRTGVDRYRRREAHKRAVWNLVGHLRQFHGWRGNSVRKSIEDLQAIHDRAHEGS